MFRNENTFLQKKKKKLKLIMRTIEQDLIDNNHKVKCDLGFKYANEVSTASSSK